jgi:2-amino-4-hydroxy-6-hydroxymethyldihydropteridine diphosphokinase
MLGAALEAMDDAKLKVRSVSPVVATRPLGLRGRTFANAAALVSTKLDPPALLGRLKRIEAELGRRRGRRWGDRPIDLDILAWDRGRWRSRTLAVPHPALAERPFALGPAAAIAPDWRPDAGLALRHLAARLTRARPLP